MFTNPLTDITTFNAIDSYFERGHLRHRRLDPFLPKLVGPFVDSCLYGSSLRYVVPVPNSADYDVAEMGLPPLLDVLKRAKSINVIPIAYDVSTQRPLQAELFDRIFEAFAEIVSAEHEKLRSWSRLHKKRWIRDGHLKRIPRGVVFLPDLLPPYAASHIENLAQQYRFKQGELEYVFDVILRTPAYASLTRGRDIYLNHPIREYFVFKGVRHNVPDLATYGGPSQICADVPLSFSDWFRKRAPSLTREQFVDELMRIRDAVHEVGLARAYHQPMTVGAIRELALKARLPPTVRGTYLMVGTILFSVGTGIVPLIPAGISLDTLVYSAAYSSACAVIPSLWKGTLPASQIRWPRRFAGWPELEKFGY